LTGFSRPIELGGHSGLSFIKLLESTIQMPPDPEQARHRLLALKSESEILSRTGEGDRATVELDQQSVGRLSRMDALQRQAMAEASERARAIELQKINAALQRIDDGEYGYCLECGEEIAAKRIAVDPAASHCIKCAN
jgi:DnaK suppressor protein